MGKKSTYKCRQLSYWECNIPLLDGYEYNKCHSCWAHSMGEEPSIQDVVVWGKYYVQDSMKEFKTSLANLSQICLQGILRYRDSPD